MNYVNYLILCIIIVLLSYNIYKKQKLESFSDPTLRPLLESMYDTPIEQSHNLNLLENEQELFSEFCYKMKHINNNYNDDSRQLLRLNNIYMNQLNLKKKESNKLLQDVLDVQDKIYNNEEELEYRTNYEGQSNEKVKKQLDIINAVIDNIQINKENKNKVFLKVN